MANTASSEKRHRQSLKRRARNTAVKSDVKSAIKQAREFIEKGDKAKAIEAIKNAHSLLDRAATRGVLHARNAARRIGRLSHMADKKFAAAK